VSAALADRELLAVIPSVYPLRELEVFMSIKVTVPRTLAIASALALAAGTVHAAIPAFLTNGNFFFITDNAKHVVTLSTNGATALAFTSSGPGEKIMISYNAECAVEGDVSTYLGIDIKVDGVAVAPSSGDNAFCSGFGAGIGGHWSSNVTNAVVTGLAAGAHTVTVEAQIVSFDAGESATLDDSIIIVQR
jgi:hypothetical protein